MNILLIRHGKAEERGLIPLSEKKDAARTLTETGRRDMRKAAKGLRKVAPDIDLLATSPLVRARETAQIVARVFGVREITEQALLAPGGANSALFDWIEQLPMDSTIALVGHEPDLSQFADFLIARSGKSFLSFKKGACALIEFERRPKPGGGTLAWLLQPGQLRKLD